MDADELKRLLALCDSVAEGVGAPNAEFIAAARSALPELLDEVERYRAALRKIYENSEEWQTRRDVLETPLRDELRREDDERSREVTEMIARGEIRGVSRGMQPRKRIPTPPKNRLHIKAGEEWIGIGSIIGLTGWPSASDPDSTAHIRLDASQLNALLKAKDALLGREVSFRDDERHAFVAVVTEFTIEGWEQALPEVVLAIRLAHWA